MAVHLLLEPRSIYKAFVTTSHNLFKSPMTSRYNMKVTIVGTGYVGLVTGTWLANLGNDVIGLDIDESKVKKLNEGNIPIYEPGLEEIYKRNMDAGRFSFTTDTKSAIQASDVIVLAVGTPPGKFHEADLSAVKACSESIGKYMQGYKTVITKSTVPVGTADMVKQIIKDHQSEDIEVDVVSNPEFLREGAAVKDVENPDRIVVGTDSERAKKVMEKLYSPVARVGRPMMFTDVKSAELIKYAANSMLATRISFMNQLSRLCEKSGANIKEVGRGIGLDSRIGPRFLQAGVGFGGSCFPKDVKALVQILKDHQCDASLFEAVDKINNDQKYVVVDKICSMMEVSNKTICVWGLSFKPKTDDMREAPATVIIKALQEKGAKIKAYDPAAIENAKKEMDNVQFCKDAYEAADGADAVILVTEWNVFRGIDLVRVKDNMAGNVLIDGRNIYNVLEMAELGFKYAGIGI